jgi:menaquinone-dependent protoporphyrinogen oxidase
MAKCLVVYSSKYGSTREVAEAVADGLSADLANAIDRPDLGPYGVIVLGSPVYAGDYLESMVDFIRDKKQELAERKTAAFITAAADMKIDPGLTGDEDELLHTQQDYADGLAEMAGGEVLATRGFGGRLVPEQLDDADRKMLSWFYRFLMRDELKGFDLLDLPQAKTWGQELKSKLEA